MAKYAYAVVKHNINIQKFLKDKDKLKELQELINRIPVQPTRLREEKRTRTRTPKISQKVADISGLPPNLATEARKMAEIYPKLYVIENLVRYVIMKVLEDKYGADWWNNRHVVSKKIAERVEHRKHFEKKNRWVAKRRAHEIFYTDFKDLSHIIAANRKEFKKIFAGVEIEAELRKLNPSRNIIAHNNPLPSREFDRIRLCFHDLKKQLEDYADEENTNP
jgi:hypothetical protein